MAAHDAWALVCRLFAGGTPVLHASLSPRELGTLPALGRAVRPAALDQRFLLCPYCQQHRAQVWGDGRGGRTCHCPECGPVSVAADDGTALALDEDWLRRKLRLALSIESRDGIDALGDGVWRLGDSRRSPVLLARDLIRLWREPALLDRVRVAGGPIRVITPKPRETRGAPFGPAVEWLALEDRFAFYGGGISFIAPTGEPPAPQASDPTTPVKGPFSADFRWVTLPDWPHGPIRLTDGQTKVFKSLWSLKVDYESAVSIHPTATGVPEEKRPERLASPTPDDNRVTHGCINVSPAFYEQVVSPTFARGGVFYVLPDEGSLEEAFPEFAGAGTRKTAGD